jgi:hypothetical protein
MNNIRFLDYDLYTIDAVKVNHLVKITIDISDNLESFWVWVESINNDSINGIIRNTLQTDKLEIGQLITFYSKNIKEISERSYTIEQTKTAILITKTNNNPITKYFQLINKQFC